MGSLRNRRKSSNESYPMVSRRNEPDEPIDFYPEKSYPQRWGQQFDGFDIQYSQRGVIRYKGDNNSTAIDSFNRHTTIIDSFNREETHITQIHIGPVYKIVAQGVVRSVDRLVEKTDRGPNSLIALLGILGMSAGFYALSILISPGNETSVQMDPSSLYCLLCLIPLGGYLLLYSLYKSR